MTDVMPKQVVDLDAVLGDEPVAPATDELDAVDDRLLAWLARPSTGWWAAADR